MACLRHAVTSAHAEISRRQWDALSTRHIQLLCAADPDIDMEERDTILRDFASCPWFKLRVGFEQRYWKFLHTLTDGEDDPVEAKIVIMKRHLPLLHNSSCVIKLSAWPAETRHAKQRNLSEAGHSQTRSFASVSALSVNSNAMDASASARQAREEMDNDEPNEVPFKCFLHEE